jgi:uncharacterized membrane protein
VSYLTLAYIHLATIVPAMLLGTYLLLRRKGDGLHRMLGKIYMGLMLFTAIITMLLPAAVGPRFLDHFGWIHLLSLLVLYTVPSAYFAARAHNVRRHRANMIGLYIGGILVAGSFALMPGRMLHNWLFAGI